MRKITTFGLSMAALAASGWIATASAQAAPDAPPAPSTDTSKPAPAPMKHHHMTMKSGSAHAGGDSGNAAVEDLNAQSLDAAKSGKPFTPSATPAPKPTPKPAAKGSKHHHAMAKKAPAPSK